MKKHYTLIIYFLLTGLLYSQSKIVFTIDSPLAGPVKPKYQMFNYSIPFKQINVIRGAYSGIKLTFMEDESNTEFYMFFIELPEINKLKFVSVSENGRNKYILENDELPLVLTYAHDSKFIRLLNSVLYSSIFIIILLKYFNPISKLLLIFFLFIEILILYVCFINSPVKNDQ